MPDQNYSTEGMKCHNQFCANSSHINDIDDLFNFIKECIFADSYALPCISGKSQYKIIPVWNYYCKKLYEEARQHFFIMEPVR